MTRLIVQADDIAMTRATTLGILDAIENGIVRSTGLFANCDDAAFAAGRLRELDGIDVGIDLNFVTGSPLLPVEEVPGLVGEDGSFRSSRRIKGEHRIAARDGYYLEFETEPFDHDQTLAEARAQVRRFLELMGRPPAYIHHHSLISPMTDRVLHEVAEEFGLLVVDDLFLRAGPVWMMPNDWYAAEFGPSEQAAADPLAAFRRRLPELLQHELAVLITHPGYVDGELLDISTYNVVRARDHQLMTSREVAALLAEADVEITTWGAVGDALPS
jgi:predicted glycoside hydrolase/deacetylase ChbG (UPF0249 family)